MAKRLSLPARVPFGVSEGTFSIGVEAAASKRGLSRSRALDDRADRAGKAKEEKENIPSSGSAQSSNVYEPPLNGGKTNPNVPGAGSGSGDGKVKTMSAYSGGNYYLYSFDGKLLQMYDVHGVLLKDYLYLGDRLVAEYDPLLEPNPFRYYTPDQIGTTRVVTDQDGYVVHSRAYDPYGGVQKTWEPSFDPLPKFSGKERDEESQLDYFGARYYDRSICRFISVDPTTLKPGAIANSQRWNLYSYCGNNSLCYFDPNGDDQINIFLGLRLSSQDYSSLKNSPLAVEHTISIYLPGTYGRAEIEKSLNAGKGTWTFYVGHSTLRDKKTKKRFGIDFKTGMLTLPDWFATDSKYVGVFACNSADYAFDLFMGPTVFALTDAQAAQEETVARVAYRMLEVLMARNDPEMAIQVGTGLWAHLLGTTDLSMVGEPIIIKR